MTRNERRVRRDRAIMRLMAAMMLLIVALCAFGTVGAVQRNRAGRQTPRTDTPAEPAVLLNRFADADKTVYDAWAPVLAAPEATDTTEDPCEAEKIFDAILEKCQVVKDCYIVGYAPELVEGWKPEYRNANGLCMTASGMWAAPGCTVATDPAVIPTGATVIIEGKVYVAADRGVNGKVIDVMMSPEEALVYGCHRADVYWCMELEG